MAFDNLRLEKGMYGQTGKSFTQVLEQLDPSQNYRGTALEKTDAFQRQLKRFDIKVKGAHSDTVEKFFSSADSAVLFPEFVARTIRQGLEETNQLADMVAAVTEINSMDYRSIYSVPEEEDLNLETVAEGASIPATTVRLKDHLVKLYKTGRMLVASYEAIRFQRLDLFSVMLRQIGAHIGQQQMEMAVNTLMNGDGNDNSAPIYMPGDAILGGSEGTFTYEHLLRFWNLFHPYELNTMVVSGSMLMKLLAIEEFRNPLTGMNFQGTGAMITPMGAKIIRSSAVNHSQIVGFDKRYALEMVKAQDITVEYDKLIDRQLERAAITSIVGFTKIQTNATKCLYA